MRSNRGQIESRLAAIIGKMEKYFYSGACIRLNIIKLLITLETEKWKISNFILIGDQVAHGEVNLLKPLDFENSRDSY